MLPVDPPKITESVAHSWYEYSGGDANGLHPSQGETNPKYCGPKPPYDHLDVDAKYSWLKTPRYDGKPMEVGPLARMVVGYASGKKEIRDAVNGALKALNAPPAVLFSTLGRIAARALEAQIMANQLEGWVESTGRQSGARQDDDLQPGPLGSGLLADNPPADTAGTKRRAARSATGSRSKAKSIKNYQAVVPTTWNAGPRDAQGQRGRL